VQTSRSPTTRRGHFGTLPSQFSSDYMPVFQEISEHPDHLCLALQFFDEPELEKCPFGFWDFSGLTVLSLLIEFDSRLL